MFKKLFVVLSCCMILFTSFSLPVKAIVTDDGNFGYFFGKEYPIIDFTVYSNHILDSGYEYVPYFNGSEFNTYFNATSGTHTIKLDLWFPENIQAKTILAINLSGTSSGISSMNATASAKFYFGSTATDSTTLNVKKNGGNWSLDANYVELSSGTNHVYIEITINTGTTGCLFELTHVDISETSSGSMFNDILNNVADIPNKVVDSITGFFEVKDDSIVSDNDNANNDLKDTLNSYDDVESSIVDNFTNSIGNLNTNLDMFNAHDFQTTSLFLSQQLTNIFDINENVRNLVMYSLIIGFAFVLIGRGLRG